MAKELQGNVDPRQIKGVYRQGDGNLVLMVTGALTGVIGITVDGGSSTPTTGVKGYYQTPYAATIVGWSALADAAGLMTMDIDRVASSAPPGVPGIPNTSTDKISASAPVTLGTGSPLVAAQSQAGGASEISTWTVALAQWDVIGFNLTTASTLKRVTVELFLERIT